MSTHSVTHHWRDVALTALAPVIWGSTYIVTSQLLPENRPFTAACLRALPAGLLLIMAKRQLPLKQDWWRLLILSALNIGAFQALLFIAAYRLPGGLAAVLNTIQPLLIMLLIWWSNGQKPARVTLGAAVVGVLGVTILLLSPQTIFEPIGIGAALLGACCMATGMWLTPRWQLKLPLLSLTGWQLFLGGVMLAPVAWWVDAPLPALSVTQVSAYIYLSIAGSLLAYVLWFRGLAQLPTVAAASLGLLSPLTAVLLGWWLLAQTVTGTAFIGLVMVFISVFFVQWSVAPKR